jgi:uncharacterized protein YdaU (DUF1376 family)
MRFVQFFPDDWNTGTARLTLEERGAYITLISHLYSYDGILENDDQRNAHLCQCSTRKFRKIKERLLELGKIEVVDNHIINEKATNTLRKASENSANQRLKAEKKWATFHKKTNENKAKPDAVADAGADAINKPITNTHTKRGSGPTGLPDDWVPSESSFKTGIEEGYTNEEIRWVAGDFADHWRESRGRKKDWNRTFHKWLRSAITRKSVSERRRFNKPQQNTGRRNSSNKGFAERALDIADRLDGDRGGNGANEGPGNGEVSDKNAMPYQAA